MPQQNPLIAEAHQRLQHLRSLPITPMRTREIQALERVIAAAPALREAAKSSAASPGRQSRTRYLKSLEEDGAEDEGDGESENGVRREVHRDGEHRRVVLRKGSSKKEAELKDGRTPELQHKRLLSDIKSALGTQHRGMS